MKPLSHKLSLTDPAFLFFFHHISAHLSVRLIAGGKEGERRNCSVVCISDQLNKATFLQKTDVSKDYILQVPCCSMSPNQIFLFDSTISLPRLVADILLTFLQSCMCWKIPVSPEWHANTLIKNIFTNWSYLNSPGAPVLGSYKNSRCIACHLFHSQSTTSEHIELLWVESRRSSEKPNRRPTTSGLIIDWQPNYNYYSSER